MTPVKLVEQKFPLISIITVSFNAAEFIEQTIKSVLSQTYPHIEYIIIDGASNDGTVEIIRKYESRLAYWHSKPDRGLAHAFNLGFAQSHGDWILYLNADDFFLDNSVVEQMVPQLMINREADVVFGRVMAVSRQENPDPLPLAKMYHGNSWCWPKFRWFDPIPHQGAFTHRSYFNKVGGFDESLRIVIEYELYLRAGKRLKARFTPINVSAMRVGGISGNGQIVQLLREYRRVQQKTRALPVVLCWINFFWRFLRYSLARTFHILLDSHAEKFSFRNRLSGNLIRSIK